MFLNIFVGDIKIGYFYHLNIFFLFHFHYAQNILKVVKINSKFKDEIRSKGYITTLATRI